MLIAMNASARLLLQIFIAWLIPGSGYYLVGRKWQGITLFILLAMAYLTGMAMADFQNVSLWREPYCLPVQAGAGSFTIVALAVTWNWLPMPIWYSYGYNIGCLYTCVVALLNLILIIDVYPQLQQESQC